MNATLFSSVLAKSVPHLPVAVIFKFDIKFVVMLTQVWATSALFSFDDRGDLFKCYHISCNCREMLVPDSLSSFPAHCDFIE